MHRPIPDPEVDFEGWVIATFELEQAAIAGLAPDERRGYFLGNAQRRLAEFERMGDRCPQFILDEARSRVAKLKKRNDS